MSTCLAISSCFNPETLNLDSLTQSEFIYIEGYMVTDNNNTVLAILKKAHELNKKIAISLSDPWVASTFQASLLEWCKKPVELIFCNDAEALSFTNTDSLDKAQEKMKQFTHKYVITCGAQGAICFDGKSTIQISAPKVDVIDTNGAGDIFAGAFLHRIIKGVLLVKQETSQL